MNKPCVQAFRGDILHFTDDPSVGAEDESYEFIDDGLLVVEDGLVLKTGKASDLLSALPAGVPVVHYQNSLIMPGFIDTHVHYPQTEMIASHGEQLLGWLTNYAFPTERKFSDINYARQRADFFLDQLLSNGTTTALVFATVHKESVEAFFECAERRNLRMICGKVLMDRNAPDYLLDTANSGFDESQALIEKWHNRQRLQYAVTPRFVPTSSSEQLSGAGRLLQQHPGLYLHTHLAENTNEVEWVKKLCKDSKNYLSVYAQHGLLGRRSVFAHGIHISEDECRMLADRRCAIAFCPTSNLFMGSGLFDLKQAETFGFEVGLGTDVGGGTSFSLLQTINEAYKVQQLRGHNLSPLKPYYLATLGAARALDMESQIGNFDTGKEADFVVLNYHATPLMELRMQQCSHLRERLFVLSTLGDDRAVRATHILGRRVDGPES